MKVPFVDLKAQHFPIQEEIENAIHKVIDRGDFALGEDVHRLEEEFAEYCGTRYAIGVDSGLSAIELCLHAFEIGQGDEVIVPAHTFVATAAAVSFTGATPVLVDVDPITYCIDSSKIEQAITARTRAIIPVHLYGLPASMDPILEITKGKNLVVIEDACQAHGATYKDRRTGSLGHAAAFSFYPTKNLGGFGDGGIITTDDEQIAEKIRALRNCGQRVKNIHELSPFNHRLDTIQAAILRVKLRYLDQWNESRRKCAALYNELFAGSDVITPVEDPDSKHVYHLYVVRTSQRDALQVHLGDQGIGAGIHYPIPVHLQPYYSNNGFHRGQFPIAEKLCDEILSLPMFPTMSWEQVQYVAREVIRFSNKLSMISSLASTGS
jgi:dTDP-4-amino-4,6-dideoxygalactose transaminase